MIAALAAATVLWVVPPAPSPMPVVHLNQGCPAPMPATWGCYVAGNVYVPPNMQPPGDKIVLEHELGHAYDATDLTDGERHRVATVLGWKRWHQENFADFYAGCRLAMDPRLFSVRVGDTYGKFKNVRRIARRCGLIARVGL